MTTPTPWWTCPHTGIGMPDCPTCDPRLTDESTRPAWAPRPRVLEVPDIAAIPAAAWARPQADATGETGAALAAVLKRLAAPLPAREARLAATLVLAPRLLTALLAPDEARAWRRAVGPEADPLPAHVAPFVPTADHAWGATVRHLRGTGLLVERDGTWAASPGLDALPTAGWPDGRAAFVLDVIRRLGVDRVLSALPEPVRRGLDAAAA